MSYYVEHPSRRQGKSEFARLAMQLALECGRTVYCPNTDGCGYKVQRVKISHHRHLDVYTNLSPKLNSIFMYDGVPA